jgi:hypothetical protein
MKLQIQGAGKSRDAAEVSFGRGGRSLRQAVGNALTGSLGSLGERLNTNTWFAKDEATRATPHMNRLREVLDRDRALIAANPELNDPEPRSANTKVAAVVAPAAPVAETEAAFRPLPPPAASAKLPESVPVAPAVMICQEPIRTRTMARLLAAQGHPQRALSIYDYLLARPEADESLRREAEALRSAQV